MESILYLKSSTDAVFLANGAMIENDGCVNFPSGSVLYVTVLPTCAAFLPYTVRFIGTEACSNSALVSVIRISSERFVALFEGRYECVFSPSLPSRSSSDGSVVGKLFEAITRKDLALSRKLLTSELSDSVSDEALLDFFSGYKAIIPDLYSDFNEQRAEKNARFSDKKRFLLIDRQNCAHPYCFVMEGELVGDIEEL